MATEGPDPKTFKSPDDAFQFPVPAVRRMEQQLRSDISVKGDRLRSTVAGSYRDLVQTAETIIDMNSRMQRAEARVAEIGRRCNTGLLERTGRRSKRLAEQAQSPRTRRFELAAQLAVFRACPDAIVRILRDRGSLLTAAKVLVISRILHKKLSNGGSADGDNDNSAHFLGLIDGLFRRLGRLRAKLLAAIERRLGEVPASSEVLLDAMSAYALATTSSAADILRHFHGVRAAKVKASLQAHKDAHPDPVGALRTWLQTMRDTPAIFPRQLGLALNRLQADPLVDGEDVQGVDGFNLETHKSWLGDDVCGFKPYVRYDDDFGVAAAKKQLSTWAPRVLNEYLRGLAAALGALDGVEEVARLRKECLVAWFEGSARISVPRAEVLEGLRSAFADRLGALAEVKSRSLEAVSDSVRQTIKDFNEAQSAPYAPPLWDDKIISSDTSHGAKRLTGSLQSSLRGKSRTVDGILRSYHSWMNDIKTVETIVEEQKKVKWQDIGENYDEDYDEEEEESRDQLLSRKDPEDLQKRLAQGVNGAIGELRASLDRLLDELEGSETAEAKAIFILRLTREISAIIPASFDQPFDLALNESLHRIIAAPIAAAVVGKHSRWVARSLRAKSLTTRNLWSDEGIPILPSPWAFRLVRDCHCAMETAGRDLWTESCAAALKQALLRRLLDVLEAARDAPQANGTEKLDEAPKESEEGTGDVEETSPQDRFIQQSFDLGYLESAFSAKRPAQDLSNGLEAHRRWLTEHAKLDAERHENMTKGASEYWKRTRLLFSLLA